MNVHLIDLARAHQVELRRRGARRVTTRAAIAARRNVLTRTSTS